MTQEERELFPGPWWTTSTTSSSGRVAEGRGLERQKVAAVADGRLLTGEQAHELGLVDELGNFQDAVELARTLANISGKPELVWPGREEETFLGRILREALNSAAGHFRSRPERGSLRKRYPSLVGF